MNGKMDFDGMSLIRIFQDKTYLFKFWTFPQTANFRVAHTLAVAHRDHKGDRAGANSSAHANERFVKICSLWPLFELCWSCLPNKKKRFLNKEAYFSWLLCERKRRIEKVRVQVNKWKKKQKQIENNRNAGERRARSAGIYDSITRWIIYLLFMFGGFGNAIIHK